MLGCKYLSEVSKLLDAGELIDTCWDVNADNKTAKMDRIRINRYMLGCKSKHHNLSIDEFKN